MGDPVVTTMGGRPRVLVFAAYYSPAFRGGGPIRTLESMIEQHGDRYDFCVVTRDGDWGDGRRLGVPSDRWTRRGRAGVWYRSRGVVPYLRALVAAAHVRPDVVYLNSVFSPLDSFFPAVLYRLGVFATSSLVIAPRGEFGPGALSLKSAKKAVFLRLSRLLRIHHRAVWHASTGREAAEVRSVMGSRARVVIAENESSLPRAAWGAHPEYHGRLRVVYLSRLAPKKGLHILLEALSQVSTPVSVSVFGSADDVRYQERCQHLADTCRTAGHDVRFLGALPHDEVLGVLHGSDVFGFPTANENFGHAIAEALCAACPVVLPDTTPWTTLTQEGGGVIVDSLAPAAWTEALQTLADESPGERRARSVSAARAFDRWSATRTASTVFDEL